MAVPTFGGYAVPTEPITAAAQVEIIAEINKFRALIGDPSDRPSAPGVGPIFQSIDPPAAAAIHNELDALIVAIDAADVA